MPLNVEEKVRSDGYARDSSTLEEVILSIGSNIVIPISKGDDSRIVVNIIEVLQWIIRIYFFDQPMI